MADRRDDERKAAERQGHSTASGSGFAGGGYSEYDRQPQQGPDVGQRRDEPGRGVGGIGPGEGGDLRGGTGGTGTGGAGGIGRPDVGGIGSEGEGGGRDVSGPDDREDIGTGRTHRGEGVGRGDVGGGDVGGGDVDM